MLPPVPKHKLRANIKLDVASSCAAVSDVCCWFAICLYSVNFLLKFSSVKFWNACSDDTLFSIPYGTDT
jgi:hypothetical protein